jgi:hypothetical protein
MSARAILIPTRFGSISLASEGDRFLYFQNKLTEVAQISLFRYGTDLQAIRAAKIQNANAKKWGCLSKRKHPYSISAAIMIVRIKKIHV